MKTILLLLTHFFSFGCYLLFFKVWNLKNYLFFHKDSNNLFLRLARYNFEYRLRKKGSWIGYQAEFGDEPTFPHGITGCFISGGAKIGKGCIIYQQVTIGSNMLDGSKTYGFPTIGNNVLIGAGAKIIGNVRVGDNCRIGANAVVAHDVPANSTVVCDIRCITR